MSLGKLDYSQNDKIVMANLRSELSAKILSGWREIFVNSNSGNDLTGDGSSSKPFKTIQRAINSIPESANGKHEVVITYSGTEKDPGFTAVGSYFLVIRSTDDSTLTTNHIIATNGCTLRLEIKLNIQIVGLYNGILVDRGSGVNVYKDTTITGNDQTIIETNYCRGLLASNGSYLMATPVTNISSFELGVLAHTGSIIILNRPLISNIASSHDIWADGSTIGFTQNPIPSEYRIGSITGGTIKTYDSGWDFIGQVEHDGQITINTDTYKEFLCIQYENDDRISYYIPVGATEGYYAGGNSETIQGRIQYKPGDRYIKSATVTRSGSDVTNHSVFQVWGNR